MSFSVLLHSVSYSGSWGQAHLSLDAFIDKAADLGYEGVMLMAKRPHLSLLDYGPKERAQLRRHLEKRKLRDLCIAGYNNFTGDAGYTAQWNLVVAALKECAKRAAEFGVTLGVQNHHDIAVGYESQYDLIQAIGEPNCRALFDAWAPALHGEDLEAAARKMAPITPHTTIAAYQKRPRYHYDSAVVNYTALTPYIQAVPIDEGFIDYRKFLAALRTGGFQGSIAYEMCSPLLGGGSMENLDRYATRFLEFIHDFRGRAGSVAAD